ncbi:nucleoside hydrolase [Hanseniaspora valbyensis NRRL Y-1626]|uniref:Nucleoside hydrolase n=1 Tax=Hanseniaspora valbyensis NRRL Y-1626 TaxID=766949 RepID=A0A1B7TCD8_9ASCO|nr:nucleoside hydrolase [Hanseniaspora valbyensis NRRL Y-1626]
MGANNTTTTNTNNNNYPSSSSSSSTLNSDDSKKLHIFLDCDPGNDDCILLVILLQLFKNYPNRLNIIGISASYGNSSVQNTLKNLTSMINVLSMGKYDINIFSGAEEPMVSNEQSFFPTNIHGANGMSDLKELDKPNLAFCKGKITSKELLRLFNEVKSNELTQNDKIIFISTGPFTLISRFIIEKPNLKKLIDKFIVMGGVFEDERGNCNSKMTGEFNIFNDPDAANTLFMDPIMKQKSIIFPLNITHKAIFDQKQMKIFSESSRKDKEISELKKSFLKLIQKFSLLYTSSKDNEKHQFDKGPPMHDVLTAMPIIEYLIGNGNDFENKTNWEFKEIDFMVEVEGNEISKTHIFTKNSILKTLETENEKDNTKNINSTKNLIDYKQESCVVLYNMNFNLFWKHFQLTFDQLDQENYESKRIMQLSIYLIASLSVLVLGGILEKVL